MNALADKVHKQGMPHSDMHSITWPHQALSPFSRLDAVSFEFAWLPGVQ